MSANDLFDEVCDYEASEAMCKRVVHWDIKISSVKGSYIVRVVVERGTVAIAQHPWLDRAVRDCTAQFRTWREKEEADRLERELRVSVDAVQRGVT
jgi:hypothetical protein